MSMFLLPKFANKLSPVCERLLALSWYAVGTARGTGICCARSEEDQPTDAPHATQSEPLRHDWSEFVGKPMTEALATCITPDLLKSVVIEEVVGLDYKVYFTSDHHHWDAEQPWGQLRRWFCYNLAVKLHKEGN